MGFVQTMSRFRTTSLCLDGDASGSCGGNHAARSGHPTPYTVLPGRRSFSVEVHAGLDPLSLVGLEGLNLDPTPPTSAT